MYFFLLKQYVLVVAAEIHGSPTPQTLCCGLAPNEIPISLNRISAPVAITQKAIHAGLERAHHRLLLSPVIDLVV